MHSYVSPLDGGRRCVYALEEQEKEGEEEGDSASSPPTTKKVAVGPKFRYTQAGSYSVHFGYYFYEFLGV